MPYAIRFDFAASYFDADDFACAAAIIIAMRRARGFIADAADSRALRCSCYDTCRATPLAFRRLHCCALTPLFLHADDTLIATAMPFRQRL